MEKVNSLDRPSTYTAHYNTPSVDSSVGTTPHTEHPSTQTAHYNASTPVVNERTDANANTDINAIQPPSYNTHLNDDLNTNEKTIYNQNRDTPPQFQIQPQIQNQSQAHNEKGDNEQGTNRYEGQHPAPLSTLQKESRLVACPSCGVNEYTAIEWVSGGTADISALLCCLCFCLPCVPYLMTSFKDVHHKCGHCGFLVAVWKRSGKTEITPAASAAAASGGAGGAGEK